MLNAVKDPIPCLYTPDPNLNLKYLQSDVKSVMANMNSGDLKHVRDPADLNNAIQKLLNDANNLGVSTDIQKDIQAFLDSMQGEFLDPQIDSAAVPLVYDIPNHEDQPVSFADFYKRATSGDGKDMRLYNRNHDTYIHGPASRFVQYYAGSILNDGGGAYSALLKALLF